MSRAALVTGAARRIGLRISERLASEGYAVVLHCSPCSRRAAEEAAGAIVGRGGEAFVLAHDLSDPVELSRVIEEARTPFGPLRLLVNNAAAFEDDRAESFGLDLWERHFSINLRAPVALSRDFARQLPGDLDGSIVNIIDQRVFRPTPQFFSYTLSKAALLTATRTMAQAFAPQKIRVNAVGPGPVLPNEKQGAPGFTREVEGLLLRQAVGLDDVADAVLFLAGARNVTGQMIAVDAGQHLGWRTPDVIE